MAAAAAAAAAVAAVAMPAGLYLLLQKKDSQQGNSQSIAPVYFEVVLVVSMAQQGPQLFSSIYHCQLPGTTAAAVAAAATTA
jgi:Ni,Fe-hydrogenase I cytochrome b subunit